MSLERISALVAQFQKRIGDGKVTSDRPWKADPRLGLELFESMLLARYVDLAAHELRASGHGHYTICSSGHENNVVLGRLTRTTDPTLVHYRSAALFIERGRQEPSVDTVLDMCLSLVASKDEPLAGGRHKVFGNKALGIMPQTSTIASHLPRAVGMAFALERRPRLGLSRAAPKDAISVVSFGDASLNHSTALGSLNAAGWVAHQRLTLPVLFVCEDNGIGVSVRTPSGWTETRLRALPHVRYFRAEDTSLEAAYLTANAAVDYCRQARSPAVLHLDCVRLLGHAGSDVDTTYRHQDEITELMNRDPLLLAAESMIAGGVLSETEALLLDQTTRERVRRQSEAAKVTPRLTSRSEIAATIARPILKRSATDSEVKPKSDSALKRAAADKGAPSRGDLAPRGLTLAQGINQALREALDRYPEALLFGEDVAKKGGVYGITKGLLAYAGAARVFNTLLDEQTILGVALGSASLGLLPIPEIQYVAYLHNAEDQLRGEALTLPFFSNGAYDNPMVVRIAGLAYQKGFGGHFHNDNSLAVLRDLPGLVLAVPARADDALELYRRAFELAKNERRVVVVVEPIALYHQKDLYAADDNGWLAAWSNDSAVYGQTRVYHPGSQDLLIVTYGNGLYLSLRAADRLRQDHGIHTRVLDLRWLAPLPLEDVLDHARAVGRVLIVDECRESGGVHEALSEAIAESAERAHLGARLVTSHVASADCYIPLGDAARLVLVSEDEIVEASLILSGGASLARAAAK